MNTIILKIENKMIKKLLTIIFLFLSSQSSSQETLLLEPPPSINWTNEWSYIYEGIINRHKYETGNSFALLSDFSQGLFYYKFNNNIIKGKIEFYNRNEHGIWFRWKDKWGQGFIVVNEYEDLSLNGNIYIDDGVNHNWNKGKLLGQFGGRRIQ